VHFTGAKFNNTGKTIKKVLAKWLKIQRYSLSHYEKTEEVVKKKTIYWTPHHCTNLQKIYKNQIIGKRFQSIKINETVVLGCIIRLPRICMHY
jgi:hypothetical protein